MRKKKKSLFRQNSEYFFVNLFITLMDICPLRLAYFLSKIIAAGVYFFDKRHRVRTIQHLMHAGMAKDETEAKTLAWKNFQFFGRMGVDAFKINKLITEENIYDYVDVVASDKARETFLDSEKPHIAMSPHMGNFMYVATAYAMIMKKGILSVMRPYDNPKLEPIVRGIQTKAGHKICYKDGALRELLGALKKGVSIGVMVDQHAGSSVGVDTTFFGQPCKTHSTPAVIHLKTGCPICVVGLRQVKEPGHFEFVIMDPISFEPTGDKDADTKKLTQLYTDANEKMIRETPEQWFWSHRRWTNINRKKDK